MFDLQSLLKKKDPSDKPVAVPKPAAGSFAIAKIHPSQNHLIGKIISFCVDDYSIQMAAVLHWGRGRKILDIKKEYLPKVKANDTQRNDIILKEIEEFVEKYGGYGTRITLAISGNDTTFRTFLMPVLKKKELDSAVTFEAKKHVPFPLDDCIFGYRPIYRITRDGTSRYKIALQAATKRFIHSQLAPFESLNIGVSHVYHTQDVIGQMLRYLTDFDEERSYTLLNIGHESTEISFYKGTTLEFSHSSTITSRMLGEQQGTTKYEYFAEMIANEIQVSLDYYSGQFSTGFHDKIYVYGDLAYSSALLDLLNTRSGMALEAFPVGNLSFLSQNRLISPEVFPVCLPVLATSTCQLGLSNLLPQEQQRERIKQRYTAYAKVALPALLVLLGASWFTTRHKTASIKDNLIGINRQVEQFRNSEAFHTYNLVKRQIALDQSYLEQIKESPSYFSLNLKELSNLVPSSMRLSTLEYSPADTVNNLYVQGTVASDNTVPPELILAEFVEDLSASPFYDKVIISRHSKRTVGDHFEIDFEIRMRGVV